MDAGDHPEDEDRVLDLRAVTDVRGGSVGCEWCTRAGDGDTLRGTRGTLAAALSGDDPPSLLVFPVAHVSNLTELPQSDLVATLARLRVLTQEIRQATGATISLEPNHGEHLVLTVVMSGEPPPAGQLERLMREALAQQP